MHRNQVVTSLIQCLIRGLEVFEHEGLQPFRDEWQRADALRAIHHAVGAARIDVVAAAHLIAAIVGSGYWFDEVYMLAIGRYHLDWVPPTNRR